MNTEGKNTAIADLPDLSSAEKEEIMKLAAVGLMPVDIALSMAWPRERCAIFCNRANIPGSDVYLLIAAGRASGRAIPQMKLREAAAAGNVDAIKTLQTLQTDNRFKELINNMDEDELAD